MTQDALMVLFTETRQQRPAVYLADEWAAWLSAIGQVIAACPLAHRQWAWKIAVASDLYRAWDGRYSIAVAYAEVEEAVRRAAMMEQRMR